MALTSWQGQRIRKSDVVVAKNYLANDELEHLNRIVSTFLEFAELRAQQRKSLRMADWRKYVDSFMEFNEQAVLQGAGRVSHQTMTEIAHERYERFDSMRRKADAVEADRIELEALSGLEKQLSTRHRD